MPTHLHHLAHLAPFLPLPAECATDAIPTASGDIIGTTSDGVATFKGIPYAAPPTGSLRFRPPSPHAPWTKPLSANQFGAACSQPKGALSPSKLGENGLFLDVWTPNASPDAHLPVMVWIHGGYKSSG